MGKRAPPSWFGWLQPKRHTMVRLPVCGWSCCSYCGCSCVAPWDSSIFTMGFSCCVHIPSRLSWFILYVLSVWPCDWLFMGYSVGFQRGASTTMMHRHLIFQSIRKPKQLLLLIWLLLLALSLALVLLSLVFLLLLALLVAWQRKRTPRRKQRTLAVTTGTKSLHLTRSSKLKTLKVLSSTTRGPPWKLITSIANLLPASPRNAALLRKFLHQPTRNSTTSTKTTTTKWLTRVKSHPAVLRPHLPASDLQMKWT